jgi:tryptophan halogenase
MNAANVNHVVIVGRDAALWLSACALQSALERSGVKVTAVELPTDLDRVEVYAALPPLEALHRLLRIDEGALIAGTSGAFSLGQSFAGLPNTRAPFFHPYGSYGRPVAYKTFFPHWLRARTVGLRVSLDEFSLTATAAKHGRMLLPDAAAEQYGRTDYGYHLPAIEYVASLKRLALNRGVVACRTKTVGCTLEPLTGDISALILDENRTVTGELFIDATGPEAALIGAALGVRRESWRDYSPVDCVVVAGAHALESVPPHAQVRAADVGWLALYPTASRTQLALAYSSACCSASDAALAAVTLSGLAPESAAIRPCDPGMRAKVWERNCIAIGSAACTFDPVHSADLHAIQLGIVHLLSLFPVAKDYAAERAELNRVTRYAFERMRDFQSAYYALNPYGTSSFWTLARESRRSPELTHKIDTFLARGEVPLYEHETFGIDSWLALFVGYGLTPDSYEPLADGTAPEILDAELARILRFIEDKVLEQATHDDYLQRVRAGANARTIDQRAARAHRP